MNGFSLNKKISLALAILVVSATSISFLGLTKLHDVSNTLSHIVHGPGHELDESQVLKSAFLGQIINEKNLILDEESRSQIHIERLQKQHALIEKISADGMKSSSAERKSDIESFLSQYKKLWELETKIVGLVKEGKKQEAWLISRDEARSIRISVEDLLNKVVDSKRQEMVKAETVARDQYEMARNFIIALSVFSIFAGIIVSYFVLRSLGRSFDGFINVLAKINLTHSTQTIAGASDSLSQAATEQASSLEETAASIEEMNSMVQKNAENARRTFDIANHSCDSAEKGKKVVQDMIAAIDEIKQSNSVIRDQVDESNKQISDIVKVIAEIGDKTKVINDIVFQTKLLSFNASVEAARAGEHGKGFAVVAEEVGNLAQMSGNAAHEISAMLESSIEKVEQIVNNTKQSVSGLIKSGETKIEAGHNIAQECGHVLEEIVQNVGQVTQMANEISTACNEQAQGVQEITKAISQLDQVTQQNAATSQSVATSAEELSNQSDTLRDAVKSLVFTVKGSAEQEVKHAPVVKVDHAPKQKNTDNVIPLRQKVKATPHKPAQHVKEASGTDFKSIPSEDDPRFKDI